MSNLTQNKRGEWVTAVPLPLFGLRKRCGCGRKFWRTRGYRAHYIVDHIYAPPKPTPLP